MNFDGIEDIELEARFSKLYDEIMAGLDSLPKATWLPEYKQAKRELQEKEVTFHAVGAELARRVHERSLAWDLAFPELTGKADDNA